MRLTNVRLWEAKRTWTNRCYKIRFMSTRPNARLIETVWTDRAREAFARPAAKISLCGVVEADHGASASPQT